MSAPQKEIIVLRTWIKRFYPYDSSKSPIKEYRVIKE